MPGMKIKILKYNKKLLKNVDYIFLGAWNFKKEIFKKEKNFLKRVVNLLLMSHRLEL